MFHVNYSHRLITNALTYSVENGSRRFQYESKTTGILVFYIKVTGTESPYYVTFKEDSTGQVITSRALVTGINYFHFLCNKGNNLSFYLVENETFYKELAILQYPLVEHYESAGNEDIGLVQFQLNYGNGISEISKETAVIDDKRTYGLVSPVDGLLLAQITSYDVADYKHFYSLIIQDNYLHCSYLVSGLNVASCFCSKQDEITFTIPKDIQTNPQFLFIPFKS